MSEPEHYGVEAFRPLLDRMKREGRTCRPNWKPIRVKSQKNKMLARALPCANPDCKSRKVFSLVPVSDPHHCTTRGAGGGDETANLCPLCRQCHEGAHRGEYSKEQIRDWARDAWEKTKAWLGENK